MMAELLAALAGHPSSLFSSASSFSAASSSSAAAAASPLTHTLRVREDISHLHPAEAQILNKLATYSTRYLRTRSFAQAELDHARKSAIRSAIRGNSLSTNASRSATAARAQPLDTQITTHIIPLCSTLLALLKGYHDAVLKIERDILANDAELVADKGFVSLANIRARLQEWDAPLSALDDLVNVLVQGPCGSKRPGFVSASKPSAPGDEAASQAHATLRASTAWTGGLLIDLLDHRAVTGVERVAQCMTALRDAVEDSWMVGLVAWVCYGQANPESGLTTAASKASGRGQPTKDQLVEWSDASSSSVSEHGDVAAVAGAAEGQAATEDWALTTSTWRFRRDALPTSISEATADSILYVGRALNTVKSSTAPLSRGTTSSAAIGVGGPLMPLDSMTGQHVALLQQRQSRPSHATALDRAVQQIRSDISEWLFRNVLTTDLVLDSFETLGNYFLQREGTFTLSLLAEIETMRRNKLLHTRSAAAGAIRASDMELALHRASIGTGAEDDPSLEKLRFVLPQGQFRPMAPSREAAAAKAAEATSSGKSRATPAHFDDLLIGVPAQLHFTATFPLDLFLSPADLMAYSRLFSYLIALKRTQSRVLGCWMSLSKSQRVRRRFTGTGEGGVDRSEERRRTELLRRSWGLTRNMLWFLDTLLGHFQTDVVDVQYTRLISQLTGHRPEVTATATAAVPPPPPASSSTLHKSGSFGSLRRGMGGTSARDRRDSGRSVSSLQEAAAGETAVESGSAAPTTTYAGSSMGNQTPRASMRGFPPGNKRIPFPSSSTMMGGGPGSTFGGGGGGSVAPSHYRPRLRSAPGPGLGLGAPSLRSHRTSIVQSHHQESDEPATLDFTSLRLTHNYFLTFLQDGLLLSSPSSSHLIRSVLETCERFVGLVERWGGDVLPSLLSEGGLSTTASNVSNIVAMRRKDVEEIDTTLRGRLEAFFKLLNEASSSSTTSSATKEGAEGGGMGAGETTLTTADESLVRPRTLPPSLLAARPKEKGKDTSGAAGKGAISEARAEADVAARRHLEQLLLRLDFSGTFSLGD